MYKFLFLPFLFSSTLSIQDETMYRLPNFVIPQHYDIQIVTLLDNELDSFAFEGTVSIQIVCVKPTRTIRIHSKDLMFDAIRVQPLSIDPNSTVPPLNVTKLVQIPGIFDFIDIYLNETLERQHMYSLSITFNGILSENQKGFFLHRYQNETTKKWHSMAATLFEPSYARMAFPCFDEPTLKATFSIKLAHTDQYATISNMPLWKQEPMGNMTGWYWDIYQPTPQMPTYLISYVITNYTYKSAKIQLRHLNPKKSGNNLTLRLWSASITKSIRQQKILKIAKKALRFFTSYFHMAFPLPKLDFVLLQDFLYTGSENWGLIILQSSIIPASSVNDPYTVKKAEQETMKVVVHEIAHQWIGNLVSIKWWSHYWLKEGLTTFLEQEALGVMYPELGLFEREVSEGFISVLMDDGSTQAEPLNDNVLHPSWIFKRSVAIRYKKGALVLRMIQKFVGKKVFQSGIIKYLRTFQYGNADETDFWQCLLNKTTHNVAEMKPMLNTWIFQSGYPLVHVEKNMPSETVYVSQEAVASSSNDIDFTDGLVKSQQCWWIPLFPFSKQEPSDRINSKIWISCQQNVIEYSYTDLGHSNYNQTWILFNANATGPYRINYDVQNWFQLTKTLRNKDEHKIIPILNKIQLIDDAAQLAWSNKLPYSILFNLLKYLRNEHHYLPWKVGLYNLDQLKHHFEDTFLEAPFKTYLLNLLSAVYNAFVQIPSTRQTLDLIEQKIQITKWSCYAEVPNCVIASKWIFKQWRQDSTTIPHISIKLRMPIFCTAIRYGGNDEWDFIFNKFQKLLSFNKTNPSIYTEDTKMVYLKALCCTRNVYSLESLMRQFVQEPHQRNETNIDAFIFEAIAKNSIGYSIAKDYLFTNFQQILQLYVTNHYLAIKHYLLPIVLKFKTLIEYKHFQQFVQKKMNENHRMLFQFDYLRILIHQNIKWQNIHRQELDKYFIYHQNEK